MINEIINKGIDFILETIKALSDVIYMIIN